MDGIQLFVAPSINLNPGSKRFSQNQGTSGRETRRPARAKRLAIQRMAFLLSLGTNKSRIAPTSGAKRLMDKMWLYMKFSVVAPGRRRYEKSRCRSSDRHSKKQSLPNLRS